MRSSNTRGGRSFALGLLLLFCGAGACRKAPPPPPKAPPVAAIVNGAPIALARVQLELDRIRRPSDGAQAAPPENVPALAHAVLSTLIERAIIVGRAKSAGYSVSDAEVQRATDALAEDARKGGESFVERLRADGETMEVLSDEMRERLLAERYVAEQTRAERASPAETRAWYEQHKAEFETPDEVHAQQIVVASADEAKSLLDQLRKGSSFEDLARAHSISPDAKSGGDLGFFARGRMPKAFDDACFSLGTGKISGVVASPYGFHVFKVLGRRAAKRRSFDEVKREAERRATAEKRAQAERQLLAQLHKAADVKIDEASLALLR
jgi:peptidyl-prolyl cis-trans isomerase C/foldase protein PrsA